MPSDPVIAHPGDHLTFAAWCHRSLSRLREVLWLARPAPEAKAANEAETVQETVAAPPFDPVPRQTGADVLGLVALGRGRVPPRPSDPERREI
jgi:hypothetical protein